MKMFFFLLIRIEVVFSFECCCFFCGRPVPGVVSVRADVSVIVHLILIGRVNVIMGVCVNLSVCLSIGVSVLM